MTAQQQTMREDTEALFIHGITGQEVAVETLPAGTVYQVEPGIDRTDVLGKTWKTILVSGYRYRVRAADIYVPQPW